MLLMLCFFFSSRRRHTRSTRDWSSDVCSSDLFTLSQAGMVIHWRKTKEPGWKTSAAINGFGALVTGVVLIIVAVTRSEERRVGKECRSRWSPYHEKKKSKATRDADEGVKYESG